MSKTKIRFFTIADYEEEEIWLHEQHKKGLRLVKMVPPCFFVFEECTPEDVVYRLDYKNGNQSKEYLQMFSDYGWEHCGDCLGWMYFRKSSSEIRAENDGEIFSDAESKIDMVQHVIKTRILPILVIFLCCVLPNFIKAISGMFSAADAVWGVIFTMLTVLYVYLLVHCGSKLVKLRNKYKCK